MALSTSERPACFGLPTIYDEQAPGCIPCAHRLACREASGVQLLELRQKVAELFARREGRVGPANDATSGESSRVASLLRGILRAMSKASIHARIKAGSNPLAGARTRRYVSVAIDMLLAGGFTRPQLCERLAAEFGSSSAEAYTSNALGVLRGLEITVQIANKWQLPPNLKAQT